MSVQRGLYRPRGPRQSGPRRSALIASVLLTAIVSAIAVCALSATQLTERGTAQQFLARAMSSLLEIDQYVLNAWPDWEAAAAADASIPLTDFPLALQVDPAGLSDGPEALSDAIAATTASLIYGDGLELLADSPQAFSLVSRGAAFSATIGRLTDGGHTVATVALIVSGALTVLLSMWITTQVRGLSRIGVPALALGLGAMLVWIAATVAQSAFDGQAESTPDPFAADLWLLAADAVSFAARNGAIVAVSAGIVTALTLVGGALLRRVEAAHGVGAPRYRSGGF